MTEKKITQTQIELSRRQLIGIMTPYRQAVIAQDVFERGWERVPVAGADT